jgi:hypothetical protein
MNKEQTKKAVAVFRNCFFSPEFDLKGNQFNLPLGGQLIS